MEDYIIVTDSTTDLSQDMANELEVDVIPLLFTIENKDFLNYPDNREMSPKEFYKLMRDQKTTKTSQINVATFSEVFQRHLDNGKDVLCITLSSGISGTYNSAVIAANNLKQSYEKNKIIVIDSLSASLGEGLLVYNAVMKKREGLSIEELQKWVEECKGKLCHWFTVDDLMHLKRGGRISGAAATFGTVLGIKPVLHIDNSGHLIPIKKVRGRRASLLTLIEQLEKLGTDIKNQTIFISHGDCEEEAKFVADIIKEKFGTRKFVINYIGPVIGTHSGPGTVALFFIGSNR